MYPTLGVAAATTTASNAAVPVDDDEPFDLLNDHSVCFM